MERYIKEYANAKRKATEQYAFDAALKERIIEIINCALQGREREFITADEAIRLILEAESRTISEHEGVKTGA